MKLCLRILIPLLLLLAPAQAADQQGVIVRQASVYAQGSTASSRVGQLPAGTRVAMFTRDGGWQEIFSDKPALTGWVRVYQVRAGKYAAPVVATEQEDSRGFLSGLASFSRKASGFFTQDATATSSGTATIGVRGLSEAEIKSAKPDFVELEKMETYASRPQRMESFTAQGGLKSSEVSYISEVEE
jgi:hypothetical protein